MCHTVVVPRLKDKGLPKLSAALRGSATPAKASARRDYPAVKMACGIVELPMASFGIADIPNAAASIRRVYATPHLVEDGFQWHNESGLRQRFLSVLEELLDEIGIGDRIVAEEFGFFHKFADIAVVLRNGVPVGVIEIKCPNTSDLGQLRERCRVGVSDPFVLGQLYNYMMLLRSNFGVQTVFGIVSNYICTRFAWLSDDSDPSPNADAVARRAPDYASASITPSPYSIEALDLSSERVPVSDFPIFSGSFVSIICKSGLGNIYHDAFHRMSCSCL